MFNLKKLIDRYKRITLLCSRRADVGSIGTALGIYNLLKAEKKQVEMVSPTRALPYQLDFLPNFSKIKYKIDFQDSLVIICGVTHLEYVGFELENREILNIDYHKQNTYFGEYNHVDTVAISASQVTFKLFKTLYHLKKDVVTCFYTALVNDSQYFTTNNVNKEVFDVVSDMITHGIDISKVAYNLNQRHSLRSVRILAYALSTLHLYLDGQLSVMIVDQKSIDASGAVYGDILAIVEHGLSLATVKISIVLIELNGAIRVSIRSDKKIDILGLVIAFGGGDENISEFESPTKDIEKTLEIVITKIKEMDLL